MEVDEGDRHIVLFYLEAKLLNKIERCKGAIATDASEVFYKRLLKGGVYKIERCKGAIATDASEVFYTQLLKGGVYKIELI